VRTLGRMRAARNYTQKDRGFTTCKIRKEKLLAESTVQALRRGELISLENISRICAMLRCQPGDILAYTDEDHNI